MIVTAIVGILASVAVPSYQAYVYRAKAAEIVLVTSELRQALLLGGRSLATLKDAVRGHRRSMAASAKTWIVSGMTTPQEVQKVLGTKFWDELAQEHGKVSGAVNFDVGTQTDRRMKVLLLSKEDALAAHLKSVLPYGVHLVADAKAAADYIEKYGDVTAFVIDSGLCTNTPVAWMVELRTALTASGLPALFVLREGTRGNVDLPARRGSLQGLRDRRR